MANGLVGRIVGRVSAGRDQDQGVAVNDRIIHLPEAVAHLLAAQPQDAAQLLTAQGTKPAPDLTAVGSQDAHRFTAQEVSLHRLDADCQQ